jgi:hypothetical protein
MCVVGGCHVLGSGRRLFTTLHISIYPYGLNSQIHKYTHIPHTYHAQKYSLTLTHISIDLNQIALLLQLDG